MNSYKRDTKRFDSITNNRVKCKCSHSMLLGSKDRDLCTYCGYFVYKDKRTEFKYKLKERLQHER